VEKNLSNLYFTIAVVFFLAALGILLMRHSRRVRRAANSDWEQLLDRLEPVNRSDIERIARDALDEESSALGEMDGSSMFSMLGGLQGLEVLERNCQVLIDLASYVQRWYPEALVVSEQLRLNARELEWHVGRLKGAAQTGNLQTAFADYAQRTVVIYYVMTRNVLELYTRASLPGLIQLEAAL
jgi:hypothetical protein